MVCINQAVISVLGPYGANSRVSITYARATLGAALRPAELRTATVRPSPLHFMDRIIIGAVY